MSNSSSVHIVPRKNPLALARLQYSWNQVRVALLLLFRLRCSTGREYNVDVALAQATITSVSKAVSVMRDPAKHASLSRGPLFMQSG